MENEFLEFEECARGLTELEKYILVSKDKELLNYFMKNSKYPNLEYAEHFWVLVSIVGGKLDIFHAKTMEECKEHLRERIDEQQYEDVIGGDVINEFVDEYLYLYGGEK